MEIAEILESISKLLWPILTAVLVWKLYPSILTIIQSRGFKIKVADMELTVQEVSDQLGEQLADLQKTVSKMRSQTRKQVEPLVKSPQSEKPKRKQINRILWVDDNPENNAYQIANLRSEGFEIRQVLSTDEALGMLLSGRFKADAIISDMGRKERGRFYPTAGLQLIRTARESNIQIPIFVYTTGQSVDKYEYEVEKAGGNGITSSPVELSQMIYTWA